MKITTESHLRCLQKSCLIDNRRGTLLEEGERERTKQLDRKDGIMKIKTNLKKGRGQGNPIPKQAPSDSMAETARRFVMTECFRSQELSAMISGVFATRTPPPPRAGSTSIHSGSETASEFQPLVQTVLYL